MSHFAVTALAKADLLAIGQHTHKRWGSVARKNYLMKIKGAFELLASQPRLGANRDDIRPGLQSFVLARHLIFFDLTENDQIRIIRVLHQAMDVSFLRSSTEGHLTAQ